MKQIKEKIGQILSLIFGTRLIVEGNGRSFAKAPMWLAVLAALSSMHLALITALLVAALGMRVRVVKA